MKLIQRIIFGSYKKKIWNSYLCYKVSSNWIQILENLQPFGRNPSGPIAEAENIMMRLEEAIAMGNHREAARSHGHLHFMRAFFLQKLVSEFDTTINSL